MLLPASNPAGTITQSAIQHPRSTTLLDQVRRRISEVWLSSAVICAMAITAIALFYFPVRRISTNVEVNYNEGWNAYRALMVAQRLPLYSTPKQGFGIGTAYPPLSFHLIALLGRPETFILVGRWISVISLLLTGALVFLIVRHEGASRETAVFSFLLYAIAIALLRADRIGMNDPQLLAEVLSLAGLYFYLRNPYSIRLLCASAALFCLAGFTKHNLIAFPIAVGLDLVSRSLGAFIKWAGALLLSAGLLTIATIFIDGRYFLQELIGDGGRRAYSIWMAWSGYHHYALAFQSLLVIATAWSIWAFRSHRVVVLAFLITHLLAFWMAGGFGVDLNIFFNALTATVIVCGIALSDITRAFDQWPVFQKPAGAFMFGLFFVSIMVFVPGQLRRDHENLRMLPIQQNQFDSAVQFVKGRAGPALCESLLLCYEAGKPFEFEPYSVRALIKTGRLPEEKVLELLKSRHFPTVQIALSTDEGKLNEADLLASLSSDQTLPDTERRFTPRFMRELLQDYQLAKRTSDMAIFVVN